MTTASVIFPWRAGDPARERAFSFVHDWVAGIGLPWGTFDTGAEPFHRSGSKNLGARESAWADVLIFHDADMIIPHPAYVELIDRAAETGSIVVGFYEYRTLTKDVSDMVYDGYYSDPFDAPVYAKHVGFSTGGVVAIRRDSFNEIGGYDERFRGWGCEDFALYIAALTVCGEPARLENPGVHFFHEHATLYEDRNLEADNGLLLTKYNQIRNVDGLREVQRLP